MADLEASGKGKRQAGKPSLLACWECRRKHVKCDASQPICSRCTKNSLNCTYVPSRRGYQGSVPRRRNRIPGSPAAQLLISPGPSTDLSPSASPSLAPQSPDIRISGAITPTSIPASSRAFVEIPGTRPVFRPNATPSQQSFSSSFAGTNPSFQDDEYLLGLFYSHFYPTHPFLVPQNCYKTQSYPVYLRLVVQLAGSQFAPRKSNDDLVDAVDAQLAAASGSSVYLVQSLLLFAIVLHARLDMAKAFIVLARACEMAINLGMNRYGFAAEYGNNDAVKEESYRRTWWELYVVDGYFAGLHRQTSFKCNLVELSASLPCSEHLYVKGMLRTPFVSLHQFDQRLFSNESVDFGSACYRIAAIRILARAIAIAGSGHGVQDEVQAVDNALRAWRLHLPAEKTEFFNDLDIVDHMMLQAHSFIDYTYILIHFPRSELALNLPSISDLACVPRADRVYSASSQDAIKSITACKDLSNLASLPVVKHSPLFICCLVFGCVVQLSACSSQPYSCTLQHRERVAVMTGLLKQMSQFWPLAGDVLHHLNRIAGVVFRDDSVADSYTPHTTPSEVIDMTSIPDTMAWLDQLFAGGDSSMAAASELIFGH
ncbi:hypothetical protein H072_155 [Dactylellina haptotyla CBS 200.50]|uniref:Zn(2)-C6 fungal-type domain-containing protein n=1 Tax=Dactylellina haptotyla (strain CBS 200.50) TaxID=1284197 RepID=S8C2G1_DACHA|nr:hypothetical protein H072_155 [Dactylellina haptotyla CBS 200.50]